MYRLSDYLEIVQHASLYRFLLRKKYRQIFIQKQINMKNMDVDDIINADNTDTNMDHMDMNIDTDMDASWSCCLCGKQFCAHGLPSTVNSRDSQKKHALVLSLIVGR